MTRWLHIGLGWSSLALAVIGIVLPLVPTTPLLLLAAYFFARGSDRVHAWLVGHPRFGPPIRDWRAHRAVSLRAKLWSSVAMVAVLGLSLAFGAVLWVLAVQALVLGSAAAFVWSRPLPPRDLRRPG